MIQRLPCPKPFRIAPKPEQPPKPKRLPERKLVTIAAGFICLQGIVLCADNQITDVTSGSKSYGCKLWQYGEDDWNVIFAYSGFKQFMDGFKGRFPEALAAEKARAGDSGVTVSMIRDAIYSVLCWFDTDARRATFTDAELLCGISLNSTLHLFRTHGTLVSEVSDYSAVLGESPLTKYLSNLISGVGTGWTIGHAIFSGAYIVRCARSWMQDCGGDTDMFVLAASGRWCGMGATNMYNIDQRLAMLEHRAGTVIAGLFDFVDDQTFENNLLSLCGNLRDEHRELRRFIPRTVLR
jgi:hypothetical protein